MASNPNAQASENQQQEAKYWSWTNNSASADRAVSSNEDVEMFGSGLLHEISKSSNLPAPSTNPYQHQMDKKKAAEWKSKPILSPGRMMQDDVPQDISYDGFQPYQPGKTLPPRKGHESITKKVSQYLLQTYVTCNPNYSYQPINNPRRVLTKPSVPAGNDGHDNEDCDYILYVNDIMGSKVGHQYQIIDALGAGTFGQVVKCQNIKTKEFIALKVIKNKPAYYNQSLVEVAILELVNKQYDPNGKHHLVRMRDSFVFRNHLCIAFEILSVNLYELIKQNQFRGLSTNLIRVFTTQILDALTTLYKAKLIHCDLKPENILLKSLESPSIKVIDLGSACHENQTVYTYIQSRFYRSPEVLLGLPYTSSVDTWSLGCIAAELFLGLPLFPGSSEYNQMSRIIELLGNPPNHMCDKGKNGAQYFNKSIGEEGKYVFTLKNMEQYMREMGTKEQPSKRYFQGNSLPEIINSYPIMRKGLSSKEIDLEMQNRRSFIDFLSGLLRLNPLERWTPQQASQHPFITQKPFLEPYVPHRYVAQSQPDTPHPLRHKSGTVRKEGTFNNTVSEQSVVDSKYHQVVGTFSEFHIKSNPTAVVADQSLATKSNDYPVHSQSLNTAQAYNHHHQYSGPSQAQSQGSGGPGFPIRKAKSQFTVSGSYGRPPQSNLQDMQQHFTSSPGIHAQYYGEEYIEGHPRYGDQGERVRIPSRMPSATESVDWEMFKDYRGGASVAGSYASSRQGSFADIPSGQSHEQSRRPSFNSPGSYRQMGFQGRKMGSFSNESFVNESHNYKSSDPNIRGSVTQDGGFSGNQFGPGSSSSSINGSPRQFHKTHKKVKSTSTFGSPIIDPSVSSRRPSVPNIIHATAGQQGSSTLPSPLQSSSGQIPPIGYGNTSKSLQGYHFEPDKKEPPKEGSEFSTSRPIDLPSSKKR